VHVSVGQWLGATPGRCQLTTVGAGESFTLMVYPTDRKAPLILIAGTKVPQETPPTFWQKYGTMITMGGFMIFQMWSRSKISPKNEAPQRPAGSPAAAAPAAGTKTE
jgi:hypothetical protein